MAFFIDKFGSYYEGVQISADDQEVEKRPSLDHYWNGDRWVVDQQRELERALTVLAEAIKQRLDDFARTRNYDGILSACTYATSGIRKFSVEGQYCVDARDRTWDEFHRILEQVNAGVIKMPSGYEEIEPLLPELTWPV